MLKKGLIQVYTGDGKGKTSAAFGLACRARGHGLKVCYISFHKSSGKKKYGEFAILRKIGVSVYGFAKKSICFSEKVNTAKIRKDCLSALEFVRNLFEERKYDVLILDEINISIREGFLKETEVLCLLDSKPARLELILTGRGVSENIVKKADLVSEIKKIKHPYDTGEKARKGIEW